MGGMCVQDGQKMLLIGDSITDCGRRGDAAPLGAGYVAFLVDLVTAKYPERAIDFVNRGIGGNTVLDLTARWDADCLAERPDWLSVMIGINDLHRTLGGVHELPPRAYRQHYDRLLERVAAETDARLVLLDPFYMTTEAHADEAQKTVLGLLPAYIEVVHDLAAKYGARLTSTQDMFESQLRHRPPTTFCGEPVHPNRTGHMLIACELLRTLEA